MFAFDVHDMNSALENQLKELVEHEPDNSALQKTLKGEIETAEELLKKPTKADRKAESKTEKYKGILGIHDN